MHQLGLGIAQQLTSSGLSFFCYSQLISPVNLFQLTSLSTNVSQTVINKFRQSFYLPVNLWVPLRVDRQEVHPTVIIRDHQLPLSLKAVS